MGSGRSSSIRPCSRQNALPTTIALVPDFFFPPLKGLLLTPHGSCHNLGDSQERSATFQSTRGLWGILSEDSSRLDNTAWGPHLQDGFGPPPCSGLTLALSLGITSSHRFHYFGTIWDAKDWPPPTPPSWYLCWVITSPVAGTSFLHSKHAFSHLPLNNHLVIPCSFT